MYLLLFPSGNLLDPHKPREAQKNDIPWKRASSFSQGTAQYSSIEQRSPLVITTVQGKVKLWAHEHAQRDFLSSAMCNVNRAKWTYTQREYCSYYSGFVL